MVALDKVESDILLALRKTRNGDLPFPAHFSGFSFDEVSDGQCTIRMPVGPQVVTASGELASAAIAMVCDISLSSAIRSSVSSIVGREIRLPTVSLEIECARITMLEEALLCSSTVRYWAGDLVTAESSLKIKSGETVGRARGRFLLEAGRKGQEFLRFPWEVDQAIPQVLSDLNPSEQKIRSFLLRRDLNAGGSGLYDQLYRIEAIAGNRPGFAQLRQRLGPHLANRSGVAQGGAVAGLLSDACRAAAQSGDGSLTRCLSTTCTYLRPVSLDGEFLTANARILFLGRRIACVSSEAVDDRNTLVARAEALFSE
jgi:acyl-coenzyme A thioesterase PaaI-like protein